MSDDGFGHASVHLGADTEIRCHTYTDGGPILSIDAGTLGMSVTPRTRKEITEIDVANARALLAAATTYAAECERWFGAERTEVDQADQPGTERAA